MPANAPNYITDERERELYRDLSRVFEDYCGDDPTKYQERESSFDKMLSVVKDALSHRRQYRAMWESNEETTKGAMIFEME